MIAVLLFFILNFLLFLPRYFFNRETSTFLPYKELFIEKKFRIAPLFSRFNDDVFRINIELTFLTFLLILFKSILPLEISKTIFIIFYIPTLILFFYHYSIFSIYKTFPALSVDRKLFLEGFNIAKSGFKTWLIISIVFFVIFTIGVVFLTSYFIETIHSGKNDLLGLICFFIILVTIIFCFIKRINFLKFKEEQDFHYLTYFIIQSTYYIISSNIFFSKKAKYDIANISNLIKESYYIIPDEITLKQKPNIFFIAIESYGAILQENDFYKLRYQKLCNSITQDLSEKDFHVASKNSKSPVTGGKSWVAYSSFLKGIHIESDFVYKYLFNNQSKYQTESVFDILEKLGYKNYLISGIGGFENYTIEWNKILSFFGIKNVIKYKDLEYKGKTFNFGPSSPDQYLLNKSMELIKENKDKQPIASFVETINSHYPFESPTKIFDNWQICNDASLEDFKVTKSLSKNIMENYFKSIEYQLKVLLDLILSNEEDSIFVLFGDHQPPMVTDYSNSNNTPIHIVSKNKSFIEKWINKGFENDFMIKNPETTLQHYEMKEIFLDILVKTY
jgi:hypothetical protein